MKEFYQYLDLSNPIHLWLAFFITFVVGFIALVGIRYFIISRLSNFAKKTSVSWDDALLVALSEIRRFFLFALAFDLASQSFPVPTRFRLFADKTVVLFLLFQLALSGRALITYWMENYIRANSEDGAKVMTTRAVSFLARLVFYSILFLWALDNFGINITALLTGLGVGGIAIALAVQNILGDILASLTIVFDKPFVPGDYVTVGEHSGHIEHIGLKTTRLKSQTGEQLIFPNADLLQSRIRNFKRMKERRVLFLCGVVYETSPENLRVIPEIIKNIVLRHKEKIRFEYSYFKSLGASSLDFETVYWVLSPEFQVHAEILQDINHQLLAEFSQRGIQFAYPTQTVFVRQ